jgi:hypothetical protein
MMVRAGGTLALASLGLVLAGCGRPTPTRPKPGPPPPGAVRLTLHVKDMAKRLNIF